MRKIMFRVYDKENKRLMYCKNSDFQWLGQTALDNRRRFVIMQFTGLKDKKEKEIYEGDIVIQDYDRNNKPSSTLCVIEFYKGMFRGFSKTNNEYFQPSFFPDCKIIGNKFENPELLKNE